MGSEMKRMVSDSSQLDNKLNKRASPLFGHSSTRMLRYVGTHPGVPGQDTRGKPQQVRSLCFSRCRVLSLRACSTLTRDLGLLPSFQPLA